MHKKLIEYRFVEWKNVKGDRKISIQLLTRGFFRDKWEDLKEHIDNPWSCLRSFQFKTEAADWIQRNCKYNPTATVFVKHADIIRF